MGNNSFMSIFSFVANSTLKGLKFVITKPYILLAPLIAFLFGQVLAFATDWATERPVIDSILYGEVLTQNPLILLANYPLELFVLIIGGIISLTVFITGLVIIARKISGHGFVESINFSVSKILNSLALVIIIFIGIALATVITSWVIALGQNGDLLGTIATIVLVVIALILLIVLMKFVYTVPAMAEDNTNAKDALKKSWAFSKGKLIKTILLSIKLAVIVVIIDLVITSAPLIFGTEYADICIALSEIIIATVIISVISFAYFENSESKIQTKEKLTQKASAKDEKSGRRERALKRRGKK